MRKAVGEAGRLMLGKIVPAHPGFIKVGINLVPEIAAVVLILG